MALEGALKLKEISYIPTDAYAAGEMKHGPIALLDESTPVVCVATDMPILDKVLSNVAEVRARGAHVIAIATDGSTGMDEQTDEVVCVPKSDWLLQPILAIVPLQLLAYYIATRARAERGQAAQPGEDRHGRVTTGPYARAGQLGDRPARRSSGSSARSSGGRGSPERLVHRAPSSRYARRRVRAPGAAPGGALLREGGRREGARARGMGVHATSRSWPAAARRRCGCAVRRRARAGRARGSPSRSTHTRHDAPGAVRRIAAMSLPDWLEPLYEAAEMRAADAWAIEERGIPALDLMERAGAGLARRDRRGGAARARCASSAARATTAATGWSSARLLREEGREVDVLAVGDLSETKGDARANLDRLPGDPPRAVRAGRARRGSGAIVDAMLGTGFEGEPREPVAGAIAAINDAGAAGRRLRRPVRRQRVDRRGRGRRGAGGRDGHLPRPEDRPVRGSRQGARGQRRGGRDRDPARRARARRARA